MQNITYCSLGALLFFVFTLTSGTLFSLFFNQKLFIYIHLSLFMNTHKPILLSSNITYWKSNIFLVKVQSALSWHAPPAWGEEEVKKFRKAFAGEGEGGKSENWSGNLVRGVYIILKEKLKLDNISKKNTFGITNLIYFRDFWKMDLLSFEKMSLIHPGN